jgi:hypothetical protein
MNIMMQVITAPIIFSTSLLIVFIAYLHYEPQFYLIIKEELKNSPLDYGINTIVFIITEHKTKVEGLNVAEEIHSPSIIPSNSPFFSSRTAEQPQAASSPVSTL